VRHQRHLVLAGALDEQSDVGAHEAGGHVVDCVERALREPAELTDDASRFATSRRISVKPSCSAGRSATLKLIPAMLSLATRQSARRAPGAISFRISSRFPESGPEYTDRPVRLLPDEA